jgi:uncharacterized protein YwqG
MNNDEKILKEYIDLTKRNTCKIDFNLSDVSILDNKIGGKPYLPVGETYPVDGDGNKMGLFLQVNLSDVSLDTFPSKGILEIFVSTNEKIFEYETDGNIVIKLYDSGLEYQEDVEYIPLSFLGGTYKLTTQKIEVIRSLDDKGTMILKDLMKKYDSNQYISYYSDKIDELAYVNSYIGGYPNIRVHDANSDIGNEDECLFFIDTENFVDMGAIFAMYMTIKKEDLKNGNFDYAEFNISYD